MKKIVLLIFLSTSIITSCNKNKEAINEYDLYKKIEDPFNRILLYQGEMKYGTLTYAFWDSINNKKYEVYYHSNPINAEWAGSIEGKYGTIYISESSLNEFIVQMIKVNGEGPLYETYLDRNKSIYYWKINDDLWYLDDQNKLLTIKTHGYITQKIKLK